MLKMVKLFSDQPMLNHPSPVSTNHPEYINDGTLPPIFTDIHSKFTSTNTFFWNFLAITSVLLTATGL
jgi:hypothetical protein